MAGIDLAHIRRGCIESLLECADNALEHLDREQRDDEINKLQECLREYCSLEQVDTWEDIENTIRIPTNADVFSEDEIAAIVNRCCSSLDQSNHPQVKELTERINRSQARQSTSMNDSPEMSITNETIVKTDPFTRQPIQDGVRNPYCHHWYERSTISSFLEQPRSSRRVLTCAYIGCDKPLASTLEEMVGH